MLRNLVELVATDVLQLQQSVVDRLHIEGRHIHLAWTYIVGEGIRHLLDPPARIQRIHRRPALQGTGCEVILLLLCLLLEESNVLVVLYYLSFSEGWRLLLLHCLCLGLRHWACVSSFAFHARIQIMVVELVYLNGWICQIRTALLQSKARWITQAKAKTLRRRRAYTRVRHVG